MSDTLTQELKAFARSAGADLLGVAPIERFADIIYKAGYASPIRTPRGEDIMAACGQLKSRHQVMR